MPQTAPIEQVSIVGYRLVPPDQLLAHPLNARRHPNAQREALRASLRSLGWIAPVVQNVRSGNLIDGHARVEEALSAGVAEIPVIDVDLSPEQEALALATFDPITALAVLDRDALDLLLRDVSTDEIALQQLLADVAAQAGLVPSVDPMAEWQGMPSFEQDDTRAVKQLTINFAHADDVTHFAALVGQDVDMATRSIWYPAKAKVRRADVVYVAGGDGAAT